MKFVKIHGLGNDYIYIDCTKKVIDNPGELSKILSDRHLGIGSDGIILLLKSNIADFKMRIFNADGSEAEMCGNGIRGLVKYIYEYNFCKKNVLNIETNCGIKKIKLDIKNNEVISSTVDMGEVIINKLNEKLVINNQEFVINTISVGNPHCVIFTDNVNKIDLPNIGPLIENNSFFPNKTNVEFVEIIDKDNIKMRVWERGSGETLACGTGACASSVISYLHGKVNNECTVHLSKGTLKIYFDNITKHVFLNGPSTKVFNGNIDIKKRTRLK